MAENSKIEWCDHSFNPWVGCSKVSPGCDHCYAEGWAKRSGAVKWGEGDRRRTTAANWKLPHKWDRQAQAEGRRYRVFCASLADVFDNAAPTIWRVELFALIAATENLDWLLLTKRIGNAVRMIEDAAHEARERGMHATATWLFGWLAGDAPKNVWLGATIVNQEEADRDIAKLDAAPACVRFLSMEPLLGPVNIGFDKLWGTGGRNGIEWVIVGGESGSHARPMHPDWARSLRDQCKAAGVPFLFKQHGEWAPGSGDFGRGAFKTAAVDMSGRVALGGYEPPEYPKGSSSADGWAMVHLAGKKAAGRMLDGVTHDGYPD